MNNLITKFEKMGARVKIDQIEPAKISPRNRLRTVVRPGVSPENFVRLDVRKDREGTFFDIRAGVKVDLEVLDIKPKDRHLLLMARTNEGKSKFLCGHDERDWFVAAIPESSSASSVSSAMEALKPAPVHEAQSKKGLKNKEKRRRKTDAYIRQGEWFFIPASNLKVNDNLVLKNEPLQRGSGKPHMAEFLYRVGGETVYVSSKHPNGITQATYNGMDKKERKLQTFRVMVRDAKVYVKGKIRHSDHKTVILDNWCLVEPNTETKAKAMRHVAFLD